MFRMAKINASLTRLVYLQISLHSKFLCQFHHFISIQQSHSHWLSLFCVAAVTPVLEIRKKSRLSLGQMPDNQAPNFGCPDENLVALNINFSIIFD